MPPDTLGKTTLDHLAVGVRQWSDAYDRFVRELGGRWKIGGNAEGFAPFQLSYGAGLRLEFLAPLGTGGFMERFLRQHGPSPHHVTFKVTSMAATVRELSRFGLETFGDRPDIPIFRELFVHPKHTGLGTLLQLIEVDDVALYDPESGSAAVPPDFPTPGDTAQDLALFGLTVADLERTGDLLGTVLGGDITDKGDGWFHVTWGPARSILVRRRDTAPGDSRLWTGVPDIGVAFILFGPADLTPAKLAEGDGELIELPWHEATGTHTWVHSSNRVDSARQS